MNNTQPEATITIPVDLYNPGEFFACCGLLELAHSVWGVEATGCFNDKTFDLFVPSPAEALSSVLLQNLSIQSDNDKNPIEPLKLIVKNKTVRLDWWLDIPASPKEKSPLKTWSGNQKIYKNLLAPLLSEAIKADNLISGFQYTVNLSGRLGVDTRSSWNKIDAGFSPNTQGLNIPTYALVEFLSSVGLQRFRPVENIRETPYSRNMMKWCYCVWFKEPLPVQLACIAVNILPRQCIQSFEFQIESNGKYKYFSRATRTQKKEEPDDK